MEKLVQMIITRNEFKEMLDLRDGLSISQITVESSGRLIVLLAGDNLYEVKPLSSPPHVKWHGMKKV